MIVTYPLKDFGGGKLSPYLPIMVQNPLNGISLKGLALLDTGADTCTMPRPVVLGLGLNFTSPPTSNTKGVGGVDIATWQKRFTISLLDPTEKIVIKRYAPAMVSCVNTNIPILLGTDNFLKDFKITIDYIDQTVTLEFDETK